MKKAYIAGPYRAKTKLGVLANILTARAVAKLYWQRGYSVFCPHSNTAFFGTCNKDEESLMACAFDWLRHADLIVMAPRWKFSSGARNEWQQALDWGMDVETVDNIPLPLWQKICQSLAAFVEGW